MASTNDTQALIGDYIDAWADNIAEPYRQKTPIIADMKFEFGKEQGGTFHWPLRATVEGGVTFAAPRTVPGDSGTPFIGSRNSYAPDWQLEAPQIIGRSRIAYEAIARSMQSVSAEGPDRKKAVRAATKFVSEGLMMSVLKKAEALCIHGRRGIGQIESGSSVVAASTTPGNENANPFDANAAGFIIDLSVSAPTWAEAIFLQSEGTTFDFYTNTGGVPVNTKLNTATNTVLTSGTAQTGAVLTSVNPPTPNTGATATGRLLRFFHTSGTAGGSGTGIFGGATYASLITNTAFVFYESGGPSTSEFISLTGMARNQGTIFNVNGVQYSVAKGNLADNVGNLKLADLVRYLTKPINKGAMDTKIRAVVPTEMFAQFANDESTLRRYAADTGKAKNGFEAIEMYLPHGSTLEIVGHNLQKDQEVVCYVPEEAIRIGAQDFDFVKRGSSRENLILEVAQSASSEMRLYGQWAPLAQAPCHLLSLTGCTY